MKSKPLYRTLKLDREHINEDARSVDIAFSSEEPYERHFGIEILDHSPSSIRLGRLNDGGPLLVDHDPSDHVGVIESATVDGDRRGRAVVRFGKSDRATEIFNDVVDGVRNKISVGYRVHKMVLDEQAKDGPDTYRVVDWEPLEVSFVSIPADATVGVGRADDEENEIEIIKPEPPEQKNAEPATKEETKMDKENKAPEIDVQGIKDEARKAEMQRIRDINTIGEKFEQKDLARQFVESGRSIDEFRNAVLERMGEQAPIRTTPDDAEVGLSNEEAKRFSFVRAIRALANPTDRRAQEAAAFEFECSAAAQEKYGRESQGVMIPQEVLSRDLTVGTATAGGNLVGTDHAAASFIEVLRNQMVVRGMGARSLSGLVGDVAIPSQTGGATTYWIATEGAAPTAESALTFGQLSLSPKTVAAYVDYTRKLMLQSDPSVEQLVRDDLAQGLAIAFDAAAINGSGSSGEPTGILNTTGIGSVALGTDGAAPTFASQSALIKEVEIDNAAMGALAYLTNPKVIHTLRTTAKVASTDSQMILGDGTPSLFGYDMVSTNQVPSDLTKGTGTNLSAEIFGNFNDLILAEWSGIDLLVDPYTASNTGTTRVTAFYDVDVGIRHASSFAAISDMITT